MELKNDNELVRIELSKRYISFVFNIVYNNSYLGQAEIGISIDGNPVSSNSYLQEEFTVLKENGYIKQ